MRKRFRGNKPISVSQELEADASGQSYQLYAGAPAFSRVEPGSAAAGGKEQGSAEGAVNVAEKEKAEGSRPQR